MTHRIGVFTVLVSSLLAAAVTCPAAAGRAKPTHELAGQTMDLLDIED